MKQTLNYFKSGATIQELNAVRIQLSNLKGGKLAELARPAQVVSFILSDIIDDPIDLISSGPTVLMKSLPKAKEILTKYNVSVEAHVTQALENNNRQIIQNLNHVQNILIGTNKIALKTCFDSASLEGSGSQNMAVFVYRFSIIYFFIFR